MSKYVPYATSKRLPAYYKVFKMLQEDQVASITSVDLAKLMKIDSTTIRRDFAAIGKLGKKGEGYRVNLIIDIFEDEFEINDLENVILIGLGHLGKAVAYHQRHQNQFDRISQIYDIDPQLIGTEFEGIEVLDYKKIPHTLDPNAQIAILTIPGDHAQEVFDNLSNLGIKGFVNFTGTKIFTNRSDVVIYELDIQQAIQLLIYDLRMKY
jgi:redox-sensing transcriptional repressor